MRFVNNDAQWLKRFRQALVTVTELVDLLDNFSAFLAAMKSLLGFLFHRVILRLDACCQKKSRQKNKKIEKRKGGNRVAKSHCSPFCRADHGLCSQRNRSPHIRNPSRARRPKRRESAQAVPVDFVPRISGAYAQRTFWRQTGSFF